MSTLDDTIQAYVSDQRLTEHKSRRFNTRNNSLNLMRLALAILVIYAHSYPLGGFSGQPRLGGETLGTWAVYGFFCISGYLIAGSRMSNPFGTFLTKRILRIYPAFWACLLATAAIFAPVEYIHENGTIDAFLTTGPVTPINYIMSNISLHIGQWDIGGTLQGVPYPGAWNGSLWTLYFEFACYILVGALLSSRLIRRSPWPLFALFTFSVVLSAQIDPLQVYVGGNGEFGDLAGLLPFFLGGSLVYMLREWLPFRWEGAAIAGIGLLIILPHSSTWASSLAAPLLTYELLWLANTVRAPRFLRTHDISYGVYIYAFPMQQLLSVFGINRLGLASYFAASIALTIPLAILSWLLIERPTMRRIRGTPSQNRRNVDSGHSSK